MREDHSKLHDKVQARSAKARDAKKHPVEDSQAVLTQDELMRWWPFTRLDPKRFPKPPTPVHPDALI